MSLLKILLTNFCIFDCHYCINRRSSNVPRARFTPDEVVSLTMDFYRRNYIEGLFLSSGIIRDPNYTMEQVVAVARKLRQEYHFRGYLHLKTIPEADAALIAEAGKWADRISINVELPTQEDLARLAPEKNLVRIESAMGAIRERIDEARQVGIAEAASPKGSGKAPAFAPAGQSTQMIVGATPSSDALVLSRAASLYRKYRLKRVYYSAFSPIPDASPVLPLLSPPLVREHRLYQADWLMRFYGFEADEITDPAVGNLDLDVDPKLAWALRHRSVFPMDLNRAPRHLLLRVPGLGVRTVDRILQARRWHSVRFHDLVRLRVAMKKVMPFVETVDHNPRSAGFDDDNLRARFSLPPEQLSLGLESPRPEPAFPAGVISGEF